ncbi:recombinase family protein [Streptomyces sp. NPDC050509]|uniref:recombinase family protein n=1 Tax=Streptomyces sp. NPDC050509 TaxID=3365620 RepID=UPI00378EF0C6
MGKALTKPIDTVARALRAVDYLRVSTEAQIQGFGIAYTGEETAAHIQRKGWARVDTFKDEGESGTLPWQERPGATKIMDLAKLDPRPFDVVVVYETRAIGREDRVFWEWVWELEDLGIFVALVDEDIDNTTEDGKARMREKANEAFKELARIRKRTQNGIQKKAQAGGHFGGTAPFGWRIKRKGRKGESYLAACKKAFRTLREAWRLIVKERRNRRQASALLNAQKMFGPGGKPWTGDILTQVLKGSPVQRGERIFRNPENKHRNRGTKLGADGRPVHGKTVIVSLPRVFTKKEVRQLNAALERTARAAREDALVYPLSTKIIGLCGKHYTGSKRASERTVYLCSGKGARLPGAPICDCSQIGAAELEARVWSEVCALLSDPNRLSAMADDWAGMARGSKINYKQRITELKDEIARQDKAISAAVLVAAQEKDAAAAIGKAVVRLKKDRTQVEALLVETQSWQEEAASAAQRATDLQSLAVLAHEHLHEMEPAQQAEVLDLLDVVVTILGPIPSRVRRDDQVAGWFSSRERVVPTLTDDAWALAEPALLVTRKGRQQRPPRLMLEALLHKARTGCSWRNLPEEYGRWETVVGTWRRWTASGEWDRALELLSDVPGTPSAGEQPLLPPIRVEGKLDPRLLIDTQGARESRLANRRVLGLTYVP